MNEDPKYLDLISTEDLLAELKKRHDCCVFMGKKTTGGQFDFTVCRRFSGDAYACLALASNLTAFLNDIIRETETPADSQGT